jgi:Lrp/AsnC family transcriptional regulator
VDSFDTRILETLQRDATVSIEELASRVGLSRTPCWRRVRQLEVEGVILKRVALLDPDKLGLSSIVFVALRTSQHNKKWLEDFSKAVVRLPEVLEVHRLSGDIDYLLKVAVAGVPGYDRFYRRLIEGIELNDVSSSFVMETIKSTTELPLTHIA